MKNSPKFNGLGAMSVKSAASLYLLLPGFTLIGSKHGDLLKEKLEFHMDVYNCTIFMQHKTLCHKNRVAKQVLEINPIQELDWPESSSDVYPLENSCTLGEIGTGWDTFCFYSDFVKTPNKMKHQNLPHEAANVFILGTYV